MRHNQLKTKKKKKMVVSQKDVTVELPLVSKLTIFLLFYGPDTS